MSFIEHIFLYISHALYQLFHTNLPVLGDDQFDAQLFAGDQLTVERATNVIGSVENGYTAQDRLEGINLQLGDWHAAVKMLEVSVYKL